MVLFASFQWLAVGCVCSCFGETDSISMSHAWDRARFACINLCTALLGSPTQPHGCGGESGGNGALYVAMRHLLAPFAERALRLSGLFYSQFATVVATARAYSVVDVVSAAVRADCQCGQFSHVMSTTFRLTGVRLSTFRMCHNYLQFNHLQFVH